MHTCCRRVTTKVCTVEDPFTKNDGPAQNSEMPAFQGLLPIQRGGKRMCQNMFKDLLKS